MKRHIKTTVAVLATICLIFGTIPFASVFGNSLNGIVVASGSENILENGGFEISDELNAVSQDKNNALLTKGWYTNSVTNTVFSISKDAYSGSNALSVKYSADGNFTLTPSCVNGDGIITDLESGIYSLSFYAKGSGAVELRYKDAAVEEISSKTFLLNDTYAKYGIDALVVGTTGNLKFEFYAEASSGEIIIDEISLNKLPGVLNGDFEAETGAFIPEAKYDFGPGIYADYDYINTDNLLSNGNFENSVSTSADVSVDYAEITEGWVTYNKSNDDNKAITITEDTHSGKKALSVTFEGDNTDDIRFLNSASGNFDTGKYFGTNTTNSRYGYFSGLSDEPYIISYWVKGDAFTRIMYADSNGQAARVNAKNYTDPEKQSEWELVTLTLSPDAAGDMWWTLIMPADTNNGKTAIIDDVQMMPLSKAKANVEAMIDALDMSKANADRMVKDIELWCKKLGADNISNYNDYLTKIGEKIENTYGNILANSGFEKSTYISNPTRLDSWAEFTENWQSHSEIRNERNTLTLSDDAHSGSKALKIQVVGQNATLIRLYGTNANKSDGTYTKLDNEPYIFSFWVKGNAKTAVYYKDPPSGGASTSGSSGTYYTDTENQDKWELVTKVLTPVNGVVWCNAFFNDTTIGNYAIFDDIMLMKVTDAEKMVIDMIDSLDLTAATAEQDIDNIKQWCAKLGTANITNYDKFLDSISGYSYTDTGNLFKNPGFEASTVVNSATRLPKWSELTSEWTFSEDIRNERVEVKITDDSHSGNNALSIKRIADETVKGSAVSLFNTELVKNSLSAVDTQDAVKDGTITGLTEGTEYIYSYWVKGNAITRLQYRVPTENDVKTVASTKYSNTATQNEWELVTVKLTADSAGIWANTLFPSDDVLGINVTIGNSVVIDDIQLVTVAQAKANVEAMITAFDVNSANADRLADDIEQWVAALGESNVSNYNDFVIKKQGGTVSGNLFKNSGFEDSTEVLTKYYDNDSEFLNDAITANWHINMPFRNDNRVITSIDTNNSHSGSNSFKIYRTDNTRTDLYDINLRNSVSSYATTRDTTYSGLDNEDYIFSYWVKGALPTAIRYKENASADYTLKNATYYTNEAKQNDWELVVQKITPDFTGSNNGVVYCSLYSNASDLSYQTKTGYIDDIQLMKVKDAEKMVIKMIDDLDITASTVVQDIYDIEQWISKLGDTNITNKSEFEEKKQAYAEQLQLSKWQLVDGVYGWISNDKSSVSVETDDIAFGSKSLSVNASVDVPVALKPVDVPYGFTNGYYMLVVWAKGSGEMEITAKLTNGVDSSDFVKTEQLSSDWTKYLYKDIKISKGFTLEDLRIEFTESAIIDAVQMYRQVGPGSSLDGVHSEIVDNKLSLIGAPDGYKLNLDASSNTDVLSKNGKITVPKYNTQVEYTYSVTNINDDTDYAFRTVELTVLGTEGEEPEVQVESDFKIRTLTDKENGVTVTGNMTSKAQLEVIPLDSESQYYSLMSMSGYEEHKFYNVFVIPASAVDGELTFTFDVDTKYNGQTILVLRYDKVEYSVEEYSVVAKDGKVTVVAERDGAFMLLVEKPEEQEDTEDTPVIPDSNPPEDDENVEDKSDEDKSNENKPAEDRSDEDESNEDKTNEDESGDGSETDTKTQKKINWNLLLWIIIGAGLILLLLIILLILLILIIRKRREEEEIITELGN